MGTPNMAKENNALLRNAANTLQMGYYNHLANGGKNEPAQERWIEALTAGADAITKVAVLESRLVQVERERDAAVRAITDAQHYIKNLGAVQYGLQQLEKWDYCIKQRGVCPENSKDDSGAHSQ